MIIVNQTLFYDALYDFEVLYKSGPLVLVYVYNGTHEYVYEYKAHHCKNERSHAGLKIKLIKS